MSSSKLDIEFFFELEKDDTLLSFSFREVGNDTVVGKYEGSDGSDPPKLSQLMAWMAEALMIGDNLPAETDLDADVQSLVFKVQKKGTDRSLVEVAACFQILVDGQTWDLYFVYTNNTSFTANASPPSAETVRPYVFGVSFSGLIDLSQLPLIGKIPGIDQLRLDKLGFYYTNATFSGDQKELHFQVPQLEDDKELAPAGEAVLTQSGFSLMAIYGSPSGNSGTSPISMGGTMALPVATGQTQPGQTGTFAASQAAPEDPLKWLAVNKTFGPVGLEKIGISYDKPNDPASELGTLSVYLDGTFQIAGFGMALDRLGLGFTIPKPTNGKILFNPIEKINFHLGGLFVDYQAPGLTIAGGFVSVPDEGESFIGEFMIGAGNFNLQAYGGFSNQLSSPSLFIFLHLSTPLGGPPFFSIKGVSGGFGVNRAFNLPTFDQLVNYPLLPSISTLPTADSLAGKKPQEQLDTMTAALTGLAAYLPPQDGEYWLALGLDVSSFEMIQVSAVLSVAFGVNLRVGLVGTAAMTLPVKEPDPIVYLQVDFVCTFSPSDGLLAATGQIDPASYIYASFVHLSGGFAFYNWFDGPDKGDFVMTIGGYNPYYQKPANYPDVPRMQMNFALDSLNFTGQSYFALTPQMMMAGIDIHATWSSGSLDAWFDMGMDFLINWKPFHYDADGYIDIGISLDISLLFVTIRITVHAGVDIEIWGPAFGGRAVVDLDIVSFTIDFGASPSTPVVSWEEFRSFLQDAPQKRSIASLTSKTATGQSSANDNKPLSDISISNGLLKQFKPGEDALGLDWLVDAGSFEIITQTSAPCTDAVYNKTSIKGYTTPQYEKLSDLEDATAPPIKEQPLFAYTNNDDLLWNTLPFGIVPMNLVNIQSIHTVTLQWKKEYSDDYTDVTELLIVLEIQSVPSALWGNSGATTTPTLQSGQGMIGNVLGGFSIRPARWFPLRTTQTPYYYLVFDTNNLFLQHTTLPAINTQPFSDPEDIFAGMEDHTLFSNTAPVRSSITQLLQANGYPSLFLQNDQALNTGQYLDDPILTYMSHTNETNFHLQKPV